MQQSVPRRRRLVGAVERNAVPPGDPPKGFSVRRRGKLRRPAAFRANAVDHDKAPTTMVLPPGPLPTTMLSLGQLPTTKVPQAKGSKA